MDADLNPIEIFEVVLCLGWQCLRPQPILSSDISDIEILGHGDQGANVAIA